MRDCLAGIIFLLCLASAFADDTSTKRIAQNEGTSVQAGKPVQVANMSEVAVGDHWTYEVRDEIAGKVIVTRKVIVTDISGNQVATRVDVVNGERSGSILYDKSWNILRSGANRYSPNDGTGVQSPLKLNAEWKVAADEINGSNGNTWKITVTSRVTGQESVTTKAGTFQTYTIETTQAVRNTKDPTGSSQFTIRTWFSPEINHWVKRNTIGRQRGLIVRNDTVELMEYGRKAAQ
jgi:hypothetical protein